MVIRAVGSTGRVGHMPPPTYPTYPWTSGSTNIFCQSLVNLGVSAPLPANQHSWMSENQLCGWRLLLVGWLLPLSVGWSCICSRMEL